jgi:hypothetical protein
MPKSFIVARTERCNIPRPRLELPDEGEPHLATPHAIRTYALTIASFDDPDGVTLVVSKDTFEIHHLGEEVTFAIVGVQK